MRDKSSILKKGIDEEALGLGMEAELDDAAATAIMENGLLNSALPIADMSGAAEFWKVLGEMPTKRQRQESWRWQGLRRQCAGFPCRHACWLGRLFVGWLIAWLGSIFCKSLVCRFFWDGCPGRILEGGAGDVVPRH